METITRHTGPGRPREYDEAAVLDAALQLFWDKGYEATSVDALTAAMGLSKSSFYAAFGSKQGVLMAALECYSNAAIASWGQVAGHAGGDGALALVDALSNPVGSRGCVFANVVTEMGPRDAQVAALGQRHFERIEQLFAKCLNPENPEAARDRARALMALSFGAMTLRKSGMPAELIQQALDEARRLIET